MKHILILTLFFPAVLAAQVTIKKGDVSCRGKNDGWLNVTVNNAATPIKSYVWQDGINAKLRSKVSAGNYCVTVTDANDCTGVDCITVEEPESALELDLSITPDNVTVPCGLPQPVFLIATATGGDAPYKINGKSGAVNAKRVTETTTIRVQVKDDNGCLVEKEQRVYILPRFCPRDPNEIVGPIGYDSVQWMSVKDTLDFTVKFENDPELATAPAQRVEVYVPLEEDINLFSFRLGSFGFGEYHFDIPGAPAFYQTRLNLVSEIGLFVDVTSGINVNTNEAFWIFESIDPETGLLPLDPLDGFLPVNDTLTRAGEGYVQFSIRPKLPGTTGDTILATAEIIFDVNEPIITNTWSNLIDAVAPSSILQTIDTLQETDSIQLVWSGSDDLNGSGLAFYELYVSVDSTVFQLHPNTFPDSTTMVLYPVEYNRDYQFKIIGVDHTGNREVKNMAEASVYVLPPKILELEHPLSDAYCIEDTLHISWTSLRVDTVDVYMSADSGMTFQLVDATVMHPDTSSFIILDDSLAGAFIQIRLDNPHDTMTSFSAILPIKPHPVVDAGMDRHICPEEVAFLVPSGANAYVWSPNVYINNPNLTIPTVHPPADQVYMVTGTDVFGCRNTDSVTVFVHSVYVDSLTHLMCNEDSVFVGGAWQTEAGFYTDDLSSSYGCDSTVVTEVILTGPCPFPSPWVYVDKDATGLNNGTSWTDAFLDLQDALAAVDYYLDVREIWIAEGHYRPAISDRDSSYILRDSVTIYGGFLGIENNRSERVADPGLVTLSGDIGAQNDSTDNVYHVITVDSTCMDCVLDGLTISFGQADGVPSHSSIGAGILVKGRVLLEDLIVERHTSLMEGAAIFNSGIGAVLTIRDCLFRLNTSGLERDILNANGAEIRFEGMNTVQD